MFRAPLDSFFNHGIPTYIDQLLSVESLKKTGYFDVTAVRLWIDRIRQRKLRFYQRVAVELGLVGVFATQLWHHLFIDHSLADIPGGWQRPARATPALAATA
jgi:asparagine synthase (glutamine-hydrolysing)